MEKIEVQECQKKMLVDLIESHFMESLEKGKSWGTHIIPENTWLSITSILNDMGHPCKNAGEWMLYFDKIKSETKAKVGAHRQYLNRTGSGLPLTALSELEIKIASIYGKNHFDGLQNVGECGFPGRKFTANPTLNQISDIPLSGFNSGSTSKKRKGKKRTFENISDDRMIAKERRFFSQMNDSETIQSKKCDLCTRPDTITIKCKTCNMFLCAACDDLFHRHPLRKAHIR